MRVWFLVVYMGMSCAPTPWCRQGIRRLSSEPSPLTFKSARIEALDELTAEPRTCRADFVVKPSDQRRFLASVLMPVVLVCLCMSNRYLGHLPSTAIRDLRDKTGHG